MRYPVIQRSDPSQRQTAALQGIMKIKKVMKLCIVGIGNIEPTRNIGNNIADQPECQLTQPPAGWLHQRAQEHQTMVRVASAGVEDFAHQHCSTCALTHPE